MGFPYADKKDRIYSGPYSGGFTTMSTTPLISQMAFICMGIAGILCIAVPLVLLFSFKSRFQVKMQPFFFGIITFVIFAMTLESFAHEFFLSGTNSISRAVLASPFLYALYGGLAAGIFEEIGRYFCMNFLMKNIRKEDAFVYGIGHGCVEAVLVGAFVMFQNIIVAMALNKLGSIENYANQAQTAEEVQSLTESLTAMVNTPSAEYLLAGVERMAAFAIQVSLSILIFKAVSRKKYAYIPLAILLHAGVGFAIGLYQMKVITNIYLLEGGLAIYAAAVAVFAYRQYQSLKYDDY